MGIVGKPVPGLRSILFFRPLIKEKLNQGVTLVLDRYAFSGVAFTGAKEVSTVWHPVPGVGRGLLLFICKVPATECVLKLLLGIGWFWHPLTLQH